MIWIYDNMNYIEYDKEQWSVWQSLTVFQVRPWLPLSNLERKISKFQNFKISKFQNSAGVWIHVSVQLYHPPTKTVGGVRGNMQDLPKCTSISVNRWPQIKLKRINAFEIYQFIIINEIQNYWNQCKLRKYQI